LGGPGGVGVRARGKTKGQGKNEADKMWKEVTKMLVTKKSPQWEGQAHFSAGHEMGQAPRASPGRKPDSKKSVRGLATGEEVILTERRQKRAIGDHVMNC